MPEWKSANMLLTQVRMTLNMITDETAAAFAVYKAMCSSSVFKKGFRRDAGLTTIGFKLRMSCRFSK